MLDPIGSHNAFIHLLESQYYTIGLSVPEMIALQSSYETIPNTAVYAIAATQLMNYMLVNSLKTMSQHDYPIPVSLIFGTYGYGYFMSKLTWAIKLEMNLYYNNKDKFGSSKKHKVCPEIRRCCMYNKVSIPSYETFVERQNYKLILLLVMSFKVGNKKKLSNKVISKLWNELRIKYCTVSPNIGGLHSSHIISILSKIGLVHFDFNEYVELDPSSRPIASLKHTFDIEKVMKTKEDHQQFLKVVSKRLNVGLFSAENVIYKSYRIRKSLETSKGEKKGTDNNKDYGDKWRDVLIPNQYYYKFGDSGTPNITFKEGKVINEKTSGSLIKVFPVDKTFVSMNEIANKIHNGGFNLKRKIEASTSLKYKELHHDFKLLSLFEPLISLPRDSQKKRSTYDIHHDFIVYMQNPKSKELKKIMEVVMKKIEDYKKERLQHLIH